MQPSYSNADLGSQPIWPLRIRPATGRGWPPGIKQVASCAAVGAGFGIVCAAGRLLSEDSHHVATFYAAGGMLTAFLLQRSRSQWWPFLLAAWLGDAASMWLIGHALVTSAVLAFCNVLEVLIAVALVQPVLAEEKDVASPKTLFAFLLFAVLLAPACSGAVAAAYHSLAHGRSAPWAFSRWFPPYALGMAVMAPLTLGISSPQLRALFQRDRLLRTTGVMLLVLAASIIIFQQTHYSLSFLWLPLLMLVVFEVGTLGAAIVTFEVLVVSVFYTLHAAGPFWMHSGKNLQQSVLLLQATILVLLLSVLPFAATLERQRELRRHLQVGMKRYQLLADNSRDIVVLSNLQGQRLYVSPAVQDVLGWSQQEWTNEDSADFMHAEDVPAFHRMLKEMLHGEDRRTFRYRTRHKNGQYLWMEASMRTLPDPVTGRPDAFVANVRDISERVESENKIAEIHLLIQQQAERDSLTQLANRRRFDEALEMEWRRGRRTRDPLALLMVDIDHFKRVNDTYGHRAGDQCLQAVAALLRTVARRPGDLTARYGGEEFAILLPDINLAAARIMADLVCLKLREQKFDVGIGRPIALTVSVGVAAQVPDKTSRADALVEAADRALYAAKRAGRNRVVDEYEPLAAASLVHQVQ